MQGKCNHLLEKNVPPDQICILARTNQQLIEIAKLLQKHSIPIEIYSSDDLYKRREMRDAFCLLKFFINPHDNLNLLSLLRSPWFRVLDTHITEVLEKKQSLKHTSKEKSYSSYSYFAENIEAQTHETQIFWEGFSRLQTWCELSKEQGVLAAFEKCLFDSGMIDFSYQYDSMGRRESNLWKLICQLRQESTQPGFNFLNFISQKRKHSSPEGGGEKSAVAALVPKKGESYDNPRI